MAKDNKVNEKKDKKPNVFVRMGRWFKNKFSGMWSELKKVTWPSFGKVVKQTGMVLAVVLFFLVVISLFDTGLSALLRLIVPAASDSSSSSSALVDILTKIM